MHEKQTANKLRVALHDDFDLKKIAESGQCFRVREFPDGMFRFITGKHILYIRALDEVRFECSCNSEEWETVWKPYFDFDRNYAALRSAIPERDSYLHQAAEEGKGIRILRQEPWETLVTFIISQRKNIPAIQKAVEALAEGFGERIETPYETLYTFPSAEKLLQAGNSGLDSCRLGYRLPYVLDAEQKCACGSLDLAAMEALDDEALLEALKTVCGVGEKVANCVALFAYGRTGLAPVDTWIRRMIDGEYGGENPFPAYGAAAGILQQYAFFYALKHKNSGGRNAPEPAAT